MEISLMIEELLPLQNRYQLVTKLGDRASRQTWLAEDTIAKERVVVKLLAFGAQVEWQALTLFEREAQILKQLNCDRIPKYRDCFTIDDRSLWFGLVEDYIPGSSLDRILENGELFTQERAKQIAIEVLEILHYLHSFEPHILHRDIKPSNLIFDDRDRIHLIDFGAVQDRTPIEGVTFTVAGTYGYTPMEQFSGRAVPASDLYALAATLVHLLILILFIFFLLWLLQAMAFAYYFIVAFLFLFILATIDIGSKTRDREAAGKNRKYCVLRLDRMTFQITDNYRTKNSSVREFVGRTDTIDRIEIENSWRADLPRNKTIALVTATETYVLPATMTIAESEWLKFEIEFWL
jgi:serine/threonine protein kinase